VELDFEFDYRACKTQVDDIYSPKMKVALLSAELAHKILLKRNAQATFYFWL
jgi:hypothetical protein